MVAGSHCTHPLNMTWPACCLLKLPTLGHSPGIVGVSHPTGHPLHRAPPSIHLRRKSPLFPSETILFGISCASQVRRMPRQDAHRSGFGTYRITLELTVVLFNKVTGKYSPSLWEEARSCRVLAEVSRKIFPGPVLYVLPGTSKGADRCRVYEATRHPRGQHRPLTLARWQHTW